jgi:predicted flap endonuclease-1-like 5' DNA nuclease
VRDLHAREVLAGRAPPPQVSAIFPFKPRERVVTRIEQERAARGGEDRAAAESNVVSLRATQAPASFEPEPQRAAAPARPRAGLTERLGRVTAPPPRGVPKAEPRATDPRFHLSLEQDVVHAPSIGPKTAERLTPHGIRTVRDLLKADPAALAVLADTRHITAEALADWQDQARLVCTVPGLRGTHAQLLVGAGYRTAERIASADADKLCADVLAFAASAPGQRTLRNGDPPDVEKIKGWLEAAKSAKAA